MSFATSCPVPTPVLTLGALRNSDVVSHLHLPEEEDDVDCKFHEFDDHDVHEDSLARTNFGVPIELLSHIQDVASRVWSCHLDVLFETSANISNTKGVERKIRHNVLVRLPMCRTSSLIQTNTPVRPMASWTPGPRIAAQNTT